MGGPWNDATDKQLLLSVIHLTAPQLPKWEQVASLMGAGFTAESVRQHFQKLRKQCAAQCGELGGVNSTPPKVVGGNGTKATPSKSTGKRKARQVEDDDDDDDEQQATPAKKQDVKVECFDSKILGFRDEW